MTGKRSVKAMLKKARPRSEPFKVLLDLGDGLQDEYNAALEAYSAVDDDDPDRDRLAQTVADLNARLAESEVEGRFVQMPSLKWAAFLDEYPPREDNQLDAMFGVNCTTAFPESVRASMIEPEMDDEDWEAFQAAVSGGDMERLARQVFTLNRRSVSVPKLPNDFLKAQPPAGDSKRAGRGA